MRLCRTRQRGAATLVFILGLFLAMALATLAIHRNLVFAQRASANQARATQAYEAAEAGAEWALAQLNNTHPIGADCLPSDGAGALSFRDRFLLLDTATARFTPTNATPPICMRSAAGWACGCTSGGVSTIAALPASDELAPAFALRFVADPHAGVVRIVASGCTSLAGTCLPGSSTVPDAAAQVSVALALYGALRRPPSSALTAPASFPALFGIDKASWARQPAVATVECASDCSSAISETIATGASMIWVDDDVTLATPTTLGSAGHPVMIVAAGRARIESGVTVVGAIYANTVAFEGGRVQGAVISATTFDGSPVANFDADVLALLARANGSFVRISGSWRDF